MSGPDYDKGDRSLEPSPQRVMRAGITEYELFDHDGSLAGVHVRRDRMFGSKSMAWKLPDGSNGLNGRPLDSMPLYGTKRLAEFTDDEPVYVTEGEKAADALDSLGLLALGTVTGAPATPAIETLRVLAGRVVRLWPDNDQVGYDHMHRIGDLVGPFVASLGFVDWPEAPPKGDAADYVEAGATRTNILDLPIDAALPREGVWAERIEGPSHIPSAQTAPIGRAEGKRLRILTAREYAAQAPETVPWIAEPNVAAGSITLVEGKIKAGGKTTFVTHLCRAVVEGRDFLGKATKATGVLYLTEQAPTSFREALRRADLLERDDFWILSFADAIGMPWPDMVESAVDECDRRGAGVLVVDTLGRFTGMRGDGENSAADADLAMEPLIKAAGAGLAIIVVRHERKAGGEVGDSGRGSSAYGGAADIIVAIRRGEGKTATNVRFLHALSRFDETPQLQAIELTADGYVALGDEDSAKHFMARHALMQFLLVDPARAYEIDELVEQLGTARTTVQRALADLLVLGNVAKIGKGRKGDPYRYQASGHDSIAQMRSEEDDEEAS